MKERAPVYNKGRNGRVISGPNGTWIPQEFRERPKECDTSVVNCWRSTARPQASKQAAMAMVPDMANK